MSTEYDNIQAELNKGYKVLYESASKSAEHWQKMYKAEKALTKKLQEKKE